MLKKIFIGLGALVGLLILAMILIPVFFDANKFRPQIESAVEEKVNGDFAIGDLKLSLWGGVYINISKITLLEKGTQKTVFAVNDAKLEIPFSSVLGGKPDITLIVKKPEINVVSGLDGKLNVSKMIKPDAATSGAQAPAAGKSKSSGAPMNFDLSFHVEDGHIAYVDDKKKTRTDLTGLDLDLKHFQLGHPFDFSFKTDLDAKQMKDLVLKGPATLKGTAAIFMKPEGLDHMNLTADGDLSKLVVRYGALFNKSENVDLKIHADLSASETSLKLTETKVTANDAVVTVKGTVDNLSDPNINLEIASSKFVFEHWQNILKPLQEFDMKGTALLNIKTSGLLSKLNINGKASLIGASLRAPGLVPRVTDLKAELAFSADTASLTGGGMKMGATDLEMNGTIKNFAKPTVLLNLKSQNFDMDSLLPQKSAEEIKAEQKAGAKKDEPMTDAQIQAAAQGPINAMKKNPVMRGLDFSGHVDFKKITVHKAQISNLLADLTFKDLVMALKKTSAQAFSGNIQMGSTIDFRGTEPSYQVTADVAGLDINAAVTNQMPVAKDTIFGKTTAKFSIAGSGLNKARVKQSLTGGGHVEIKNGSWSSLSAMKEIGAKAGSLPIPGIKEKIGNININDKFRQLKADLKIAGGKINITNLIADMEGANTTISGQGWVDFDMNNSIAGKVVTPAGGDVPPDIRAADGRMSVPFEIGCLITSPCFKADPTVQALGKAYAKTEGTKAIKKAIEGIDNQQVKDLLKKLPF